MNKKIYKTISNRKILFTLFLQLFLITTMQGQSDTPIVSSNFNKVPYDIIQTTEPLRGTGVYFVDDQPLGGKPTWESEDLWKLKQAIASAKSYTSGVNNTNIAKIVFTLNKTYDISLGVNPTPENGILNQSLIISDAKKILFYGQNATIMNLNPVKGGIKFLRCSEIVFQNLNFDYKNLPFTQAKITAINAGAKTFTVKIDDGFPYLDDARFALPNPVNNAVRWGCFKDANGKLIKGANNLLKPNFIKNTTTTANNIFDCSVTGNINFGDAAIGNYFVYLARNNSTPIFITEVCSQFTFKNINIYSSPGGAFAGQDDYGISIMNCSIKPGPDLINTITLETVKRVHSTNADIIHVAGSFIGPFVRDCYFESYTDDAVNLKTSKRNIVGIPSPNQLYIQFEMKNNEILKIFNPDNGQELLQAKVNVVATYTGTSILDENNSVIPNVFIITLDRNHGLPSNSKTGLKQDKLKIYNLNRSTEYFVFKRNKFVNGRRFGMLVQARKGIIEDCEFTNLSSSGISIDNHLDWSGEGYVAQDITIKLNRFNNCGFDTSYNADPNAASITTVLSKLENSCLTNECGALSSDWQGLKNISITNNTINYNKTGMNLRNIFQGVVTGNIFNNVDPNAIANSVIYSNSTFANNNNNNFRVTKPEVPKNEEIKLIKNGNLVTIVSESKENSVFNIAIFDIVGRKLLSKKNDGKVTEIDISAYRSGLYIVRIENEKFKNVEKLIF